MAFYTENGLKFETKEDAFAWFETTLMEKSPLGSTYETLHEHEWNGYHIEATGIDERSINISLDKPDFKGKFYKRVNYNTYGLEHDIDAKAIITELETIQKTVELVSYLITEETSSIKNAIEKGSDLYLDNVFTDFSNIVTTVQVQVNLQTADITIQMLDEKTGYTISNTQQLDDKGRINTEIIPSIIQSFFLKVATGKFDGREFKAGNHYLDGLLRYAQVNDKEIKLEIL